MEGWDPNTKSTLTQIRLLSIKSSPRDGAAWTQRLKEEYKSLIAYTQMNNSLKDYSGLWVLRVSRKDELQRSNLELDSYKEKIKENQEKIKLNMQLPYLVGKIVEVKECLK